MTQNQFEMNQSEETSSTFDELESEKYLESAGSGKRFVNFLLDTFFMYIFLIIITLIFGAIYAATNPEYLSTLATDANTNSGNSLLNNLYGIGFMVIFYTLIEFFTKGRSLGKLITGTKIITVDGEVPSFKDCLVRSLCRCIPFEPFSFLGSTDGGWHDSISHTRVVIVKK